jgi:hypothetical protein
MVPGLYQAEFATPLGEGYGIVKIGGGRIQGGDSDYWYSGGFMSEDGQIDSRIRVKQHNPYGTSVFGPLREFMLNLVGTDGRTSAYLRGTTPQMGGVTISIKLKLLEED